MIYLNDFQRTEEANSQISNKYLQSISTTDQVPRGLVAGQRDPDFFKGDESRGFQVKVHKLDVSC